MFWQIVLGLIGLALIIAPIWYAVEYFIDYKIPFLTKQKIIILGSVLFVIFVMYFIADGGFGLLTFVSILVAIPWLYGVGKWLREEMDDSALHIIASLLFFKSAVLVLFLVVLPFISLFSDFSMLEIWGK